VGKDFGPTRVTPKKSELMQNRVVLKNRKKGKNVSILITGPRDLERRTCRKSAESALFNWFKGMQSEMWNNLHVTRNQLPEKWLPEKLVLITDQIMTYDCSICNAPHASFHITNLINRLQDPLQNTLGPWFLEGLLPVQPGSGFRRFVAPTKRFSIFINYEESISPFIKEAVPINKFGLSVISAPSPVYTKDSEIVDIVFVHGLGGCPTATWTSPKTKWLWLEGLTEQDGFQNTRISTFGYDSRWRGLGPDCCLDVTDFAMQLLDGLEHHYEKNGPVYPGLNTLTLVTYDICCA
jgi:hypothetical protein